MPEIEFADNAEVLTLKVPYSDISRYDTSGRLKELEKAAEPTKEELNLVKRFVVATAGIFFLMIGLIGFSSSANTLVSIVCIIFGLLIIWTFIARPEMQKRKAALSPATTKNPEVSMIFGKHNIVMRSANNELRKDWSELAEYRKTKKGMHFTFSDGTEAYLPLDAFYGDEPKTLTTLLQSKKII
jgi:hypothetical protein